ncbi:MAG: acetyl-CoA carboxylase biotin carboxylase subunit [Candidatus Heimdallarchaeota archaeon]|nr:acetyl-CoA carboxylase biotin carboxylase subunit [Candidatus Heimdallarchaeota archaeon]MDH5644438.1 acetyl-CoA carboxylase biotin carboxylase subunit [Candidatus Heimdallarchaeota archaeon]
MVKSIDRLLVANRGEIAVRIVRAARMLEMETVAIYSEQDRHSMHVRLADHSVSLEHGPARENYLNIQKILDTARSLEVDAIHPGYGFLSESAPFAQAVIDDGFTWVGPPPEAIARLGDKIQSRKAAMEVGVPLTPGTDTPVLPGKDAISAAQDIGYPIMVKAAYGGGGMGMAVVRNVDELNDALKRTRKQAEASFGRPDVFLERYVEGPRHIEIQFMADSKGNVIHMGERECSIQRRHQKIIEEAPSPAITEEEREFIGQKVKKLAKLVKYENAGTAEFLYKDGEFFFNEVNARLQVEHPVTEMVTGRDIVVEQLRIAKDRRLSWKQKDIEFNGHAIELRICAEDPIHDFRPSPGKVTSLVLPGGMGVRFDTHIYENYDVPTDYDSLLGKLIIWGEDRNQAIYRAYYALSELAVIGFPTNSSFHRVVLANKEFHEGKTTTNFIEETQLIPYIKEAFNRRVAACFAAGVKTSKVFLPSREDSKWKDQARLESTNRGI